MVNDWVRYDALFTDWKSHLEVEYLSFSLSAPLCLHSLRNNRERRKTFVGGKLDLTDTIKDGARVMVTDAALRRQLLLAFTEDSRLHIQEVRFCMK